MLTLTIMATLYKTNGERKGVKPASGATFKLKELQQYVGGYVEPIYLDGEEVMLVNEDGHNMELPYNHAASRIARYPIMGDALLITNAEWD